MTIQYNTMQYAGKRLQVSSNKNDIGQSPRYHYRYRPTITSESCCQQASLHWVEKETRMGQVAVEVAVEMQVEVKVEVAVEVEEVMKGELRLV